MVSKSCKERILERSSCDLGSAGEISFNGFMDNLHRDLKVGKEVALDNKKESDN